MLCAHLDMCGLTRLVYRHGKYSLYLNKRHGEYEIWWIESLSGVARVRHVATLGRALSWVQENP